MLKNRIVYCLCFLIVIVKGIWKIAIARHNKMVFLFGSPAHSNMGDQAQTFCLTKWFSENYHDYGIFYFRYPETKDLLLKILRFSLKKNDLLVCHSGYHLTDLYKEQDVYCKVARLFPDHSIWIFPQTINYKEKKNLLETANIMNSHGNVTIMSRDEQSFETAKKYFSGCHLLLYPDIVTSLIGTKTFSYKREGVLLCFRNDKEAFYTKEEVADLRKQLSDQKTELADTTLEMTGRYVIDHREEILNNQFDYYSRFKLIITDRYHGTIFSLIAGTPVIVMKTMDHKLSSGVKWFPDSFKDYVYYAQSMEEAYSIANRVIKVPLSNKLPPYFKENYYDKLKAILEDDRN